MIPAAVGVGTMGFYGKVTAEPRGSSFGRGCSLRCASWANGEVANLCIQASLEAALFLLGKGFHIVMICSTGKSSKHPRTITPCHGQNSNTNKVSKTEVVNPKLPTPSDQLQVHALPSSV